MAFNLDNYVKVDELIKIMNEKYPEGRLVSEILDNGVDYVVFKTSFFETAESEVAKCTGHARQQKSDHQSWFEKCEQKSRGRCLRVLLGTEPTFEEMEDVLIEDKTTSKKASNEPIESNLSKKVKQLEEEGLVEDISHKQTAVMGNIKQFAMDLTNQDLDQARRITAQAFGELGISKTDVSINNLQSIKNKIQDIVTFSQAEVDKGE